MAVPGSLLTGAALEKLKLNISIRGIASLRKNDTEIPQVPPARRPRVVAVCFWKLPGYQTTGDYLVRNDPQGSYRTIAEMS